MDLLPTVNKAHSLILQDEKQRGISKGDTPMVEASAFAVKNNFRNSEKKCTSKNPHLKCGTCDKIGHTSNVIIAAGKVTPLMFVENCRRRILQATNLINESTRIILQRLIIQMQMHNLLSQQNNTRIS
ncbi:hypothetical protein ACOSP7_016493 [Xanthoceras sorbifolium]